ncbi:MAG TPA: hypothetical protein VK468_05230, partial [Pyrinomonadaceae bacterium]|nr:hypothetical protein [Pyrinomonadaceae bacterium]
GEIIVIKKGEIRMGEKPVSTTKQPKKEAACQLVATVMNWVRDFETRKLEETRLAIERFQHM